MQLTFILRPRVVARIVAFFLGYFWLPCQRCGRWFAGFECGETITIVPAGHPGGTAFVNCVGCDLKDKRGAA
mgnify:CR=1 FL=1